MGDHWRMILFWKGKFKLKKWLLEGIQSTHVRRKCFLPQPHHTRVTPKPQIINYEEEEETKTE